MERAELVELVGGLRGWQVADTPPEDLDEDELADLRLLVLPTDSATLQWYGPWAALQGAFAERGAALRVKGIDDGHGTATVASGGSDLRTLIEALEPLRDKGYVVGAALGETTSAGWDEVHTRSATAAGNAVFWNEQAHASAFDGSGTLVGPLALHWAGDRAEIAAALETSGFAVVVPGSDEDAFTLRPR